MDNVQGGKKGSQWSAEERTGLRTNCSYSQGWYEHASGRPHSIGPHHEGKGEQEEAG